MSRPMPIYVTRPDADKRIGCLEIDVHLVLALWLVFVTNVLLWGLVGLVDAARLIVGWFA